MEGYQTIKEVARDWGVTQRRVQVLCAEGKIPGVTKFGKSWAIPVGVKKPADGRVTTGEYKNWRQKHKEKEEVKENSILH
jgi:hypothetical protein